MTDVVQARGFGGSLRNLAVAVAMALALSACGGGDPAPQATEQAAIAAGEPGNERDAEAPPPPSSQEREAQAAAVVRAAADELAAVPAEELRERARGAHGEQRLYAPSGDNAVEYYLALREKRPDDVSVSGPLADLFPYILIAAEQNLGRGNLVEAQRLLNLMTRIDPGAPALGRIEASIAQTQREEERRAEAETALVAQAETDRRNEQQTAAVAAQQAETARLQEALAEARREAEAARAETERLAQERAAAEVRARELAAQAALATDVPAAPTRPAPEILSAPAPSYPREALRSGVTGEVTVEFTVQPDGSVSDPRVVSSTPSRTFDREAINAVRRWQFASVDEPVLLRRTIAFQP